jgi:hypothetical protein
VCYQNGFSENKSHANAFQNWLFSPFSKTVVQKPSTSIGGGSRGYSKEAVLGKRARKPSTLHETNFKITPGCMVRKWLACSGENMPILPQVKTQLSTEVHRWWEHPA